MVGRPVTCVLADDHPAILDSLARFLREAGVDVVGQARDGDTALAQIEEKAPQVALVDLRMPGLDGVEIARRAAICAPGTAVIVATGYGGEALPSEALDAGARGIVLKASPLGDFLRAIEFVVDDGIYVDPVLGGSLLAKRSEVSLTQRERDVLRWLANGCSNEEIGQRLFISPETVRTHVRKAVGKLGAQTRTQAVAEALRRSLIS